MDPAFLALSRLRRRRFDDAIVTATELLEKNPLDQVGELDKVTSKAVWWIKCKALTEKTWIDDTELEDEGVAEILLDDNAIAQLPRSLTILHHN